MYISLRNTKGIKKVFEQIKELDSETCFANYGSTTSIASDKLVALVRYDIVLDKVLLNIYNEHEHDKEIDVSIRMIDCIYSVH